MRNLAVKFLNLFSKEKTVTLQNFYDEVGKIAKENNERYFTVEIKLSSNHGDGMVYEFVGYINGFSHIKGETIGEVIKGFKEYKKKPENSNFNVVIIE